MIITIDRFEGTLAVLEFDGRTFNVPRALLPPEASEGDVLRFAIEIDQAATDARRQRVRSLESKLFKR
jgi:hypothetical protein